ncbi:hypothetical protein FRC07_010659 [Ceratobasidium sp. 392]|nr:hypothetical protein FRC07_010659 [Ceratobasidium sp. 392]
MATNHFGPFVFTKAVLDLMKGTSAKPGSDVRIVSVSSETHGSTGSHPVKFANPSELNTPFPPVDYNSWSNRVNRYGRSKLANILFISELQRRLDAQGSNIIALSLHPGSIATEGSADVISSIPFVGPLAAIIAKLLFTRPADGALNSVFAATNPIVRAQPGKYKGKYLTPVGKVTKPSKLAQDEDLAKRLWDLSEKVVESSSLD